MAFTFKGGIHPATNKNTRKSPITPITPPASVCIPLSQHVGAPCTPCVKVGDVVDKGQIIGTADPDKLGCPAHASVSGRVTKIDTICLNGALPVTAITIENDFQNRISPAIQPFEGDIRSLDANQIVQVIRDAGIAGMGGATFPTYAKVASAAGKVSSLIVNCAECEPYITANHRLLLEHPEKVVGGIKILLKALSVRTAVLAIEKNKMDAVKAVAALDFDPEMIRICVMKTKYPQGDERQLIYALTGKEIPAGKLPSDIGYVVFNAETCAAIYNAFATGMPLIERIVTVDGDCVESPSNLLVPLGTPVLDLLEYCHTDLEKASKLIVGGPMMGKALWEDRAPVTKGTSAVLAFGRRSSKKADESPCIRCGRCIAACPMHLMPRELFRAYMKGDLEKCRALYATSCVECGSCSYSCPAKLDLTQAIAAAKQQLRAKRPPSAPAVATKGGKENSSCTGNAPEIKEKEELADKKSLEAENLMEKEEKL